MDRRLITPAEAALLLAPANSTAIKCVEVGLLSLLGAGRIAFEKSPGLFSPSALVVNPPGTPETGLLPLHLMALEQALIAYGKGKRLVSSEVVHALQKCFGPSYDGYLRDEVAPGLIKRQLLVRTDSKWLGLFSKTTYHRTPDGDALIAPIQRLMLAIEALPSLLSTDPEQALRIARSAGVLLVMSPKARCQIPMLRKLLQNRDDDSAVLVYLPLDSERESEWEQTLELGEMALAFDVDALLDAIETVGSFTSGGDGSSSDGGDGGGGGD